MQDTIDTSNFTPKEKDKLRGMLKEAVNSHYSERAHKDLRKDIADRAKDELGVKPKLFNKAVRTLFNDDLKSMREEVDSVSELVDLVTHDGSEDEED